MGEFVLVGIIALLMYHLGARNERSTSNQRIAELETQVQSLKASKRREKSVSQPKHIDNTSGAKFAPYIPPKGKVS